MNVRYEYVLQQCCTAVTTRRSHDSVCVTKVTAGGSQNRTIISCQLKLSTLIIELSSSKTGRGYCFAHLSKYPCVLLQSLGNGSVPNPKPAKSAKRHDGTSNSRRKTQMDSRYVSSRHGATTRGSTFVSHTANNLMRAEKYLPKQA